LRVDITAAKGFSQEECAFPETENIWTELTGSMKSTGGKTIIIATVHAHNPNVRAFCLLESKR